MQNIPILNRGAVSLPGSSLSFKTGDWRTQKPVHVYGAAPCHSACPAGEDAQAWIAKLQEGHPREAWETLVQANPMPAVTGRVCPHPCEFGCNRGQFDAPINIHSLERWLGDQAIANGWSYPRLAVTDVPQKRVAVVGAGPAGLSCAYHLARRGYEVTILDALTEPGGLMRTALPITRLPRDVLDAEISRILALGIRFEPHVHVGAPGQPSLKNLRKDYDAVFLAPGTSKPREWAIDDALPPDHHTALEMLKTWIAVGAIPTPHSVAIHGGGNTGIDLARVFKRAGVAEVHMITASGLPGPDTDPNDVLNIVPREYEQAVEEGIQFHAHRTVKRLIVRGTTLTGVEVVRLRKLPQENGRTARVPFEGTETILKVDMIVPAIGEVVDPQGFEGLLGTRDSFFRPSSRWGELADHPGVFVGGDARGGFGGPTGTVSAAVGDGRRAAEAIDASFRGIAPNEKKRDLVPFERINTNYYDPAPRQEGPVVPVALRTDTDEIDGPLSATQMAQEAARCFSCGNCLACDNCWTLCPDSAVLKTDLLASDGSHYIFDLDYCKGCGLCAHECPCGYIKMVEDQ